MWRAISSSLRCLALLGLFSISQFSFADYTYPATVTYSWYGNNYSSLDSVATACGNTILNGLGGSWTGSSCILVELICRSVPVTLAMVVIRSIPAANATRPRRRRRQNRRAHQLQRCKSRAVQRLAKTSRTQ